MADQELLIVVRMRDEASAVLAKVASAVGKVGSTSSNALGPTNALTGAVANQTSAVKSQTAALQQAANWAGIAKQAFSTLSSGIVSATSNAAAINNMADAGVNLGRNLGTAATAARTFAGGIAPILAGGGSIASQFGAIAVKAIPFVGQLARVGLAYAQLVDAAEPLVAKHDELMRRLSTLTHGQVAAEAFFKGIKNYANETGISIAAATERAVQFAKAGRDLGISAGDTLGVAVTAEQLVKISGASPPEAEAAYAALQKALSSTKVEATDLSTILAAVPQIAHQIARGLGVSVDELRRMVAAGTLTGRQISDALQKQSGEIDESFKQLPRSVAESKQRIANSIDDMMTRFAQSLPGVRGYQQLVDATADAIDALNKKTTPETPQQIMDRLEPVIFADSMNLLKGPSPETLAGRPTPDYTGEFGGRVGYARAREDYARAKAERDRQNAEAVAAERAAQKNAISGLFAEASTAADRIDPLAAKLRELKRDEGVLTKGLEALKSGMVDLPSDVVAENVERLTTALRKNAAEAANTVNAYEQLKREITLREEQDAKGLTPVERAITNRAKMLQEVGAPSEEAANDLAVRERLNVLRELIQQKEIERRQEGARATTTAQATDATKKAALATAFLGFELKNIGNVSDETRKELEALIERYNQLSSATTPGSDKPKGGTANFVTDMLKPLRDEVARLDRTLKALPDGSYAVRKAETEARASGVGSAEADLLRQTFAKREGIASKTAIDNLKEETELVRRLATAVGDVNKQNEIRRDFENARKLLDVAPADRERLAQAQRDKDEADKQKQEAETAYKTEQDKIDKATAFARETFKGFFTDLKDGLKKGQGLWEAFGNAARNALNKITEKIVDLVSNKLMDQLFEGLGNVLGGGSGSGSGKGSGASGGGGDGGIFGFVGKGLKALASFLFADGGIMTGRGPVPLRKYAGGGIATSPQLAMFGEGSVPEAYVPVPSGRIPVELRGGGGRGAMTVQTNISVNMAAPADGQGSGGRGGNMMEQARELGAIVTAMVNKNLQDQMRPGGLLNPSGSFSAGVVQ